jgi:hypothetical protein
VKCTACDKGKHFASCHEVCAFVCGGLSFKMNLLWFMSHSAIRIARD